MSRDEFTKLFKYLEAFRKEMNEKFEVNRAEHLEMNSAIAEVASQLKDTNDEFIILNHQVQKHEKQIHHMLSTS